MVVRTANEWMNLPKCVKPVHHDLDGLRESSDGMVDGFVVEGCKPGSGGTDQRAIGIVEIV